MFKRWLGGLVLSLGRLLSFVFLFFGFFPVPGLRPAAQSLSFCLAKKKVTKEKGDPTGRVPCASLRGNLRCSGMGRRCGTRFVRCAHAARTAAASQRTKRGMLRCRARPTPCASRHGQRGGEVHSGHRCARPWLGWRRCFARRVFLLPLPLAGEGWGEGKRVQKP